MSEIQNLRTLVVVNELGNFHRAALALNISQPAVSKRIRALEASLDCELLDRTHHRVQLTDRGQIVVREAEGVLEQYARLRQMVTEGEAGFQRLELGVVEAVLMSWFPDFLIRLRERYRNLDINLHCSPTAELEQKLQNREVDLAFMLGPTNDGSVIYIPVNEVEMCFIAHKDLDVAPKIQEFVRQDLSLITFTAGSRPHTDLLFALKNLGVHKDLSFVSSTSIGTMLNMVNSHQGVAVLPRNFLNSPDYREIDFGIPLARLRFAGSFLKSRVNPIYQDLCDLAVEVVNQND